MKTLFISLQNYIQGSIQELHNVTWPTKKQAVRISVITIVFMLVAALLFGAIDELLSMGVKTVINLTK